MWIRRCELATHPERSGLWDLRIANGSIAEIVESQRRPESGTNELDAAGGALLPGLHDHHTHLLALAASLHSLRCGPPEVETADELASALRRAAAQTAPGEWIRGVAYHDSVAGPLDRNALDAWVPERPVRIQHRSGALWILNTAGLEAIGTERLAAAGSPCERDAEGRPTGRFVRADAWLREALPVRGGADALTEVGALLARFGVVGATDATPTNGPSEWDLFGRAQASGSLPQRLLVMGDDTLPERGPTRGDDAPLLAGARKWILDEARLPDFDVFTASISRSHAHGRPCAVHCVTRTDLAFAIAGFREAGVHAGDRIEHASVADDEAAEALAGLGITVVTQPNFLFERGDRYAVEVEARDRPWLYRCKGFDRAGVALGGGTDAPFGDPDPWIAMHAAVERASRGGNVFEREREAVAPERALALFTTPADAPGGTPRQIEVGRRADLVVLDRPWSELRRSLGEGSRAVRATFREGERIDPLEADADGR